MVGSGNQAERKIEIMDNFLDLGRSMVPDNLFQVLITMTRMVIMMTRVVMTIMDNFSRISQIHSGQIMDNLVDHHTDNCLYFVFQRQATFQTAGTKYEEELDAATNTTNYKKVLAYR